MKLKKKKHITYTQRLQLEALLKTNKSKKEICHIIRVGICNILHNFSAYFTYFDNSNDEF